LELDAALELAALEVAALEVAALDVAALEVAALELDDELDELEPPDAGEVADD
jgi:hypothetical protein